MRTPVPGGFLVALEGIDGCGKSSVALALAQYCGEYGVSCVLSKEPTCVGPGAELRRSAASGRLSLEEEYRFFVADRRAHVERTIAPALAENAIVILDRYYWSTAAYQGIRGMDPLWIIANNELFAPRPHLVLLVDAPPEAGHTRIRARGDAPNSFEALEDQRRIREIYHRVQATTDYGVLIDASRPQRDVIKECTDAFLAAARKQAGDPASDAEFFGG